MTSALPLTLAESGDPLPHVLPHNLHDHPLFSVRVAEPGTDIGLFNVHDGVYSFFITNHILMMTVAAVLLVLAMLHAARRIAVGGTGAKADDYVTRGKGAGMIEVILIYLREEMARPALGKLTDQYIGYIWTTFFFILFCNLLGLVPLGELFATVFGIEHLGGTATGNLAVTGTLAMVSFFMILWVGIKEHGAMYFAHFAPVPLWPFMKGSSPAMFPVALLLVLLEIVGAFVKPFALCMRLFANMLAGHLVLAVLIGMILTGTMAGYLIAIPVMIGSTLFMLLELFVAFLQAFIFAFLTVLFIAQGAVHEHDEHADHEPHDDHEHVPLHEAVETEPHADQIASLQVTAG